MNSVVGPFLLTGGTGANRKQMESKWVLYNGIFEDKLFVETSHRYSHHIDTCPLQQSPPRYQAHDVQYVMGLTGLNEAVKAAEASAIPNHGTNANPGGRTA